MAEPNTTPRRVVMTIRGGAVEGLISNCTDVEILVIDRDTQGMDDSGLSHDVDGKPFVAHESCGCLDPEQVERAFRYTPPGEDDDE